MTLAFVGAVQAVPGFDPYLLRALVVRDEDAITVHASNAEVSVTGLTMSRQMNVPTNRVPIVVFLSTPPRRVYVDLSFDGP